MLTTIFPLRMLRRERFHAIQREDHLDVHRLFRPERAVVVEYGDALRDWNVVRPMFYRHSGNEVSNRFLAVPLFHEGSGSGAFANAVPVQTTSASRKVFSVLVQFTHPLLILASQTQKQPQRQMLSVRFRPVYCQK